MRIAVASGKGGTGKTTVAVNLSLSIAEKARVLVLDCDVEEPNAHLFLEPDIARADEASVPIPVVDPERCDGCGMCAEVCAYNALAVIRPGSEAGEKSGRRKSTGGDKAGARVLVFDHLCHGCGACSRLCPRGAITETGKRIGVVEWGRAGRLWFAHGRLDVGQIMSPPLIRRVKELGGWRYGTGGSTPGAQTASGDGSVEPGVVIIDAPPGTSCPVISAVQGCDVCVLVTEPTPFGMHDLELAAGMLRNMNIPAGVVINRDGIGDSRVEEFCETRNIPVLARIPFSEQAAKLYSAGLPLVGGVPGFDRLFAGLFDSVHRLAGAGQGSPETAAGTSSAEVSGSRYTEKKS